ncbi:MAG: efflux RND transporter periplasmic adaptor subunit [Chloroflexaceae bacterium]|nr:efflux RND transporter periplasmic adaptor subunit [Chloroflexaceae bacterium]
MKKPATTPQRPRWKRWIVAGGVILVIALIVAAAIQFFRRSDTAQEELATVAVNRGSLALSVSGSGTVAAEHTLDLPFQTGGRVEVVLVEEGDTVQAGRPLARLETRELELTVADAEASLVSAQAAMEQTQGGNATPQDLASSQASVDQARAQLAQKLNGTATESDLADAAASLRSAQASLEQHLTSTQNDIAVAQSRLRSAQAKLDDLLAGPKPEDLSSAQRTYDQALTQYHSAVTSLQETGNRLSQEKTQAHQKMEQAALNLQTVQSEYSTAYWRYQEVSDKGSVPSTTELAAGQQPSSLTDYGELEEAEAFRQAEIRLRDAEKSLETAQLTYEQAHQAEITGVQQAEQSVASAEATLRDAEVQLSVAQQGATTLEITQAREEVEQARIDLERLQGNETSATTVQRQAAVDQAASHFYQLQEGASSAEIEAAQASLDQAMAQYEKLTAPSTETDLRIQQANVLKAENALERARIDLENAELDAPFDGIIIAMNIVPGSIIGESTAAFTVIDRDPLHVDLTLNENDVTQVAVGQEVQLTISALTGWEAAGTVTYVAPVAETDSSVVTYRVRVSFPDNDPRVKVGMTADLEIIANKVENVLLVPSTALIPQGEQQTVMLVDPVSQSPRPQVVETGLSDGTYTEITSGLEEGNQIVANPTLESRGSQMPGLLRIPGGGGGPPPGGGPPGGGSGGGRP